MVHTITFSQLIPLGLDVLYGASQLLLQLVARTCHWKAETVFVIKVTQVLLAQLGKDTSMT